MTDQEIANSFAICVSNTEVCDGCVYKHTDVLNCRTKLHKQTAELLLRLVDKEK